MTVFTLFNHENYQLCYNSTIKLSKLKKISKKHNLKDFVDNYGYNLLHCALYYEHIDIIYYLLNIANINPHYQNIFGESPNELAIWFFGSDITELFSIHAKKIYNENKKLKSFNTLYHDDVLKKSKLLSIVKKQCGTMGKKYNVVKKELLDKIQCHDSLEQYCVRLEKLNDENRETINQLLTSQGQSITTIIDLKNHNHTLIDEQKYHREETNSTTKYIELLGQKCAHLETMCYTAYNEQIQCIFELEQKCANLEESNRAYFNTNNGHTQCIDLLEQKCASLTESNQKYLKIINGSAVDMIKKKRTYNTLINEQSSCIYDLEQKCANLEKSNNEYLKKIDQFAVNDICNRIYDDIHNVNDINDASNVNDGNDVNDTIDINVTNNVADTNDTNNANDVDDFNGFVMINV